MYAQLSCQVSKKFQGFGFWGSVFVVTETVYFVVYSENKEAKELTKKYRVGDSEGAF